MARKTHTDIDQTIIHSEDLTTDKPFFSGEITENSEYGIGRISETAEVQLSDGRSAEQIVEIYQETIGESINRLAEADATITDSNKKTSLTSEATKMRAATGMSTLILRDGITKKNNNFSYNVEGITKENNVFFTSNVDNNKNNNTSDRTKWKRGVINNDILAQRFNLWDVRMEENIIYLSSTSDFQNYLFETDQLKNGLVLSFIATNNGTGYVSGGYRLMIDNVETKLFEYLDETEEVLASNIHAGDMIEIFYNKNANSGNGAFFLKQKTNSEGGQSSDIKIGDIVWKDHVENYSNLLKADGAEITLNNYQLFYDYIERLFITNPEQFSLTKNQWLQERAESRFNQINKYNYESQYLYCYKNEVKDEVVYLYHNIDNLEKMIDIALYNTDRELLSIEKCNRYGVWGKLNNLNIPANMETIQLEDGFKFINFTSSTCIEANQAVDGNNSWSIIFSVIPYQGSSDQHIVDVNFYNNNAGLVGMLSNYNDNIKFTADLYNSSNTSFVTLEANDLVEGTQYWIKITYSLENNVYILYTSTDGENYTSKSNVGSEQKILFNENAKFRFGFTEDSALIVDTKSKINDFVLDKYARFQEGDRSQTLLLYAYNSKQGLCYTKSIPTAEELILMNTYNSQGYKFSEAYFYKSSLYNMQSYFNLLEDARIECENKYIKVYGNFKRKLDIINGMDFNNIEVYFCVKLTTFDVLSEIVNFGNNIRFFCSTPDITTPNRIRFRILIAPNGIINNVEIDIDLTKPLYIHFKKMIRLVEMHIKQEDEDWRKVVDIDDAPSDYYFSDEATFLVSSNSYYVVFDDYKVIMNEKEVDYVKRYDRVPEEDITRLSNIKTLNLKSITNIIGNTGENTNNTIYQEKASGNENVIFEAVRGQYYIKVNK